ncbi:uncharacterized protein [Periplaneta americana]|uniref:uncharacterized protein n=1 Tax=Periplaneta americana TaxID=6978 RepID=UPI0037E857EA
MHSWTSALLCLLVLLSLSQGQDEQPSDSLRTAIEAVSRRQRDLATAGSNYYSGGLSQYRYPERDSAVPEELAFLASPRDFTGDGQPENIGYGYQKTIASPTGIFPPQAPLENDVEPPHPSNSKVLEKILLEYLEDEMKAEDEDDDDEYLHRGSNDKRSAFRERAGEERGKLEAIKKRGRFGSTAFRERAHDRLVDDVEQRKRKLFTEALVRKMEEEEDDERRERERGRLGDEDENEEDYLDVLRSVWEKYRRDNPNVIDIEDISEGDVSEILNYLGESGLLDDEDMEGIKEEAEKRQQGGGDYDFLVHNAAMGGWGGGGHQFRKRWNQRLDGDENQKGSFLYSLKFVSPAVNREAIESLKDDDGLDLPDERDEDILRLSPDINRREPDPWFPAFERGEAPEELFGNPSEEEYQRLLLAQQSDHRAGPSRKRLTTLVRPHYNAREISPIPEVFLTPEKKYLYDTAIMKKRYPVTKRSSNFYTSPPLLHHKNFAFADSEPRKKKDAIGTNVATTDPKVARELNQIFSSPTASDHTHSEPNSKQPAHAKENSVKPSVDTEHVATTHSPVTTNSTVTAKSKEGEKKTEENVTIHSDHAQRSASEEETVEQPVTMSRAETPLDIKKKSINWSDYFGIDRRRKKAGPNGGEKESIPVEHPVDNEWLLNQYYKTFAMNTNPGKKRSAPHMHDHMSSSSISQAKSKKSMVQQPFDTRVFDTDIFARTAQREASKKNSQPANSEQSEESRIDSMDAKLRSIEDQIVNEAVKYTGAHEGSTDTKEIQEVKDKVMARLAAAYSLEKMRLALGEFKSSLMAQKMSRYNPENRQADATDEKKKKRVAVKKEKAEDKKDEDKKKRGDDRNDESEEDEGEFLDGPVVVQPLSEGDMGRRVTDMDTEDDECPVLEEILDTCRSADNLVGDHGQFFLPLCSLHQICYLCGPELGAPSPTACDLMFITEADSMCLGDADCQTAARRSVAVLRRGRGHEEEGQCWRSPCIAHHFLHTPLTVPLPAATGR